METKTKKMKEKSDSGMTAVTSTSDGVEVTIYSQKGEKTGKVTLPSFFETPWKSDVVHQVVTAEAANARVTIANTKDRSDVRGGGRKPWQQKGTGRARHGSSRSPLWRGGGSTFGPQKEKDYSQKINKRMRRKALAMVLARKAKDGELIFVDKLIFAKPSAKDAKATILALGKNKEFAALSDRRNNAALIAIAGNDSETKKSFRNFGNVLVEEARNLTASEVLGKKYLIIERPEAVFELWSKTLKV